MNDSNFKPFKFKSSKYLQEVYKSKPLINNLTC